MRTNSEPVPPRETPLRNGSETNSSFDGRANGPHGPQNAQPVGLGAKRANGNAEFASESSLRTLVAGFARIRTFAARSLKSCDFSL